MPLPPREWSRTMEISWMYVELIRGIQAGNVLHTEILLEITLYLIHDTKLPWQFAQATDQGVACPAPDRQKKKSKEKGKKDVSLFNHSFPSMPPPGCVRHRLDVVIVYALFFGQGKVICCARGHSMLLRLLGHAANHTTSLLFYLLF